MFKYIFWAIVIYLFVRFIFNFVIPVLRATRQMRNQVKDFQDRMHDQEPYNSTFQGPQSKASPRSEKKAGDYIDFEEVK